MRFTELFDGYRGLIKITGDSEVSGLTMNSKEASRGDVFFAVRGSVNDGNAFIPEAINRGASAVVTENPHTLVTDTPIAIVKDIYDAMAFAANRFYRHPAMDLRLIGITGTNGKTTTALLLQQILSKAGFKTGLIGTLHYSILNGQGTSTILTDSPSYTTPDAISWTRILKQMQQQNVDFVVAEVSSHALALKRVNYCTFYLSIFTNLSHEHLDFHQDIQQYYLAKLRLFNELTSEYAIFNIDDPYCRRAFQETPSSKLKKFTCGINDEAMYRIHPLSLSSSGLEMLLSTPSGNLRLESELVGLPNTYNIAMAATAAMLLSVPEETIKTAIKQCNTINGRLQRIETPEGFTVFIDYAHTPDALQKVIQALRPLTEGKIITVFGCGGNRDRSKRPLMGRIATELSDFVIITSDNPRMESPSAIIRDIIQGIKKENYIVIEDRKEAILEALKVAQRDDIVLIAGKGHERYQEIQGIKVPFSDIETVKTGIRSMQ